MEFIEELPLPPDIQRKIFMLSLPRHPCVYEIQHYDRKFKTFLNTVKRMYVRCGYF
jgi:hypothetical protein